MWKIHTIYNVTVVEKGWKQPKCLNLGKAHHLREYYAAGKKNEKDLYTVIWSNL